MSFTTSEFHYQRTVTDPLRHARRYMLPVATRDVEPYELSRATMAHTSIGMPSIAIEAATTDAQLKKMLRQQRDATEFVVRSPAPPPPPPPPLPGLVRRDAM